MKLVRNFFKTIKSIKREHQQQKNLLYITNIEIFDKYKRSCNTFVISYVVVQRKLIMHTLILATPAL